MPRLPSDPHDRHSTVPVADRTPAHLVITPELLAATSPAQLPSARLFHRIWFSLLGALCERNLVVLFDEFVIGRPDPLTLEVAARLQQFNKAHDHGEFFDENDEAEQAWYREHEDDWDDEDFHGSPPDPPTMVERTYVSMCRSQEFERVRMWAEYEHMVVEELRAGIEHAGELVRVWMRAETLLADVAPLVRLGTGIVIDCRIDAQRRQHRRRAA